MGLTARQAAGLFAGTLGFGVLTFASGLMIGVGIAPGLLEMPQPAAAPAAPAKSIPAPAPSAGPAIAAARPAGAPATAQPAAAAPAGAAQQTADASAAAAPPVPPIPVKDFRVGLPLQEVAAVTEVSGPDAVIAGPVAMAGGAAANPAMSTTQGGAKMAASGAAPGSPAAAAAMPSPFLLSVQVGSFLVKQNADRLAAELNSKAYAAQVVVAQNPGGKAWYHVVLAPVHDVNAVTQLAQEFSATEGRSAQVVSWLDGK